MPTPRERICAVIVSYNSAPSLRENVAELRPQVDALLIVDNGSGSDCLAMLEKVRANYDCEIICNKSNLGIACALNAGVDFAIRNGFDWLVTFDQDSRVSKNFIASMLQTYENEPSRGKIAMLLPSYVDPSSKLDLSRISVTSVAKDGTILAGMTSGSMTKIRVFQLCGAFREDLFIDRVDIEFCLRINRSGWRIVQSEQAVLFHGLGQISCRKLFGRTTYSTNHSAGRRYYITRNRLLLWWLYLTVYPAWVVDDLFHFAGETAILLLMEKDKGKKLWAILLGIRDALIGRFGYQVKL